jgi:hypothetical protein
VILHDTHEAVLQGQFNRMILEHSAVAFSLLYPFLPNAFHFEQGFSMAFATYMRHKVTDEEYFVNSCET